MFVNKSLIKYMVTCMVAFFLIFPTVGMEETPGTDKGVETFNNFMTAYNLAQDVDDIRNTRPLLEEAANHGSKDAIIILDKVEKKEMIQRIGDLGIGMLLAGVSVFVFLYCIG